VSEPIIGLLAFFSCKPGVSTYKSNGVTQNRQVESIFLGEVSRSVFGLVLSVSRPNSQLKLTNRAEVVSGVGDDWHRNTWFVFAPITNARSLSFVGSRRDWRISSRVASRSLCYWTTGFCQSTTWD